MAEEGTCGICFEDLADVGGAVALPCACHTAYCLRCWDRALAASVTACRRANCPSCRTPMRVEFRAEEGRLRFTCAAAADDWQTQIYEQAKPLQVRLLRQYEEERGAFLAEHLQARETLLGDGAEASGPSAPSAPRPSSSGAGAARPQPTPRCVCGSRLSRKGMHERVVSFIREGTCHALSTSQLRELLRNPPVVCDLCGRPVRSPNVWTCDNGRKTVLHAAAYDVCESCFEKYTCGGKADQEEEGLESPTSEEDGAAEGYEFFV